MNTRRILAATALAGCLAVTACSSPPSAVFTPDTAIPTLDGGGTPPVPVPGASGPVAVIATNLDRQGSTYDIALVDVAGVVHRRVTAKLPLIKANQSMDFPLVSASDTLVYFLDGDTDIKSMSFSGSVAPAVVKKLPDGATNAVTFAVSADGKLIAVGVIAQQASVDQSKGRGYVENLANSDGHLNLFSNTGTDSFRWPVGWQGKNIVDAVGQGFCGMGQVSLGCVGSYHVIDSTNGSRAATVCETAQQSTESTDTLSPMGAPTVAGTACAEFKATGNANTTTLYAVDWSGHSRTVVAAATTVNVNNCFLAPDAVNLACTDNTSQALTIIGKDGVGHSLGRRFGMLGWIDNGHLVVDIDATTLGIVSVSDGSIVSVKFDGADRAYLATTMPGGF